MQAYYIVIELIDTYCSLSILFYFQISSKMKYPLGHRQMIALHNTLSDIFFSVVHHIHIVFTHIPIMSICVEKICIWGGEKTTTSLSCLLEGRCLPSFLVTQGGEKCANTYRQTFNIERPKSPNSNVSLSSCSCLCPIHWSHVLTREWRCSWSGADRRCSNYIWVFNNFTAY